MNDIFERFTYNPVQLDIPRSKINMRHSHKTTYDTGRLIPIYWREVLPGSTCKLDMSQVTRMQTPIFPIMDNAFIDTYFFFVPNRILWDHWEEFMGENKSGFWEQEIEYTVPQIKFMKEQTILGEEIGHKFFQYGPSAGSLADYLGVPITEANLETPITKGEFEVNALPFRAYYQIFNDWFRDENLMYPKEYDKGDATIEANRISSDIEDTYPTAPPFLVAKFHDRFTSALPQPQKHDDVLLPLGSKAPVVYSETPGFNSSMPTITTAEGLGQEAKFYNGNSSGAYAFKTISGTNSLVNSKSFGLEVDLSTATGATINALRQAFAVQRYYEKLARGGSRYVELLKTMFGTTSPDGRLQRAEFLGGFRKAVNIDQVVQTSSTNETTPQGNVAAYSLTTSNEEVFTKSFVEHGILMGVQVIRPEHSYQDGLNRFFIRKTEFDYYNPTFSNIGDQAILNKEIFLAGDVEGSKDEEAFGYQEAWYEYRSMNNRVSGEFRSDYYQTLDAWHFADNYAGLPSLSFAWLEETPSSINRNIAVSSRLANQWMTDIFFKEVWTQPMPVYSIPGLIDHY